MPWTIFMKILKLKMFILATKLYNILLLGDKSFSKNEGNCCHGGILWTLGYPKMGGGQFGNFAFDELPNHFNLNKATIL